MDSVRVLYVEDDPTDRELTLRHLRQHAPDLEVRVVGTGLEAREVVAGQRFDLVLLDYRLPDVDGLQLLQELLTDAPNVPVVMVTGSGDHEVAVAALKTGAIDYVIKKPGHLDRLPAVVRETLGRSQHERSRRACGLRILYVEHDPADVDLTLRHLAAHAVHLNAETVNTGAAALRKLDAGRYDLVLLDYRMPDMNGLEILQELRERGIHLPVVMVTGHGDEETAVQALKLGATDYVVKREGYLTQLPSTIESAIAQSALADEKEALLVLNGITRTVASTLNLDEVLPRVASAACSLLRVDRSLVSLLSDDGVELVPVGWHGWPAEVASHLRFTKGQDIPGRAAALGRAVSGPDILLMEAIVRQERTTLEGIAALLSVPIVAHDRLLGVLTVATTRPHTFIAWEETLLTALAAYAAVGIENANLYEGLRVSAIQLEATVEERTRELRATNAQLQEATRLAEVASRHKTDFLAHMSHELRTPLNSILGFAELLQDPQVGAPAPKQARYLSHIHQSGQHLLALINDLLDLSKIEAGRLDLRPVTFTLSDALTAALDQFRVQADAKRVALALRLEQAPDILVADPLRFKQILYNLVSNAVKFTPEGGSITVTARTVRSAAERTSDPVPRTSHTGDFVEIAVADTGIGIKAEDLSRLFQEFTQLDSSLAKPHQGTGLGLALTKRLVALHGGSVTVTSPGEGQGSTFTVTLPLRPPV